MRVLAIDTCGVDSSLALAQISAVGVELAGSSTAAASLLETQLIQKVALAGRNCAEQIMPALRSLLMAEDGSAEDGSLATLDAIVVARGPGSFTGVRVGLSTAKAMAQALSLSVVGVSRLQVLANVNGARAALLDAGRGEFYWGAAGEERSEAVLTVEAVREQLAARQWTEADLACCEESVARVFGSARLLASPTAEQSARLAQMRVWNKDFDDIAAMDGHYLRRSQAEVVADARLAQKSAQGAAL